MSRTPRPGFTSRRRQALTRRFALERFEPRSTATPVSLAAFAVGVSPIAAELGSMHVQGGG